jgi:hypothetical protein
MLCHGYKTQPILLKNISLDREKWVEASSESFDMKHDPIHQHLMGQSISEVFHFSQI